MKKILITCVVFALVISTTAFAEEKKDNFIKKLLETAISPIETVLGPVTELEKIIVSPSRFKEKLGASSCSISVIGQREFEAQKIDTVKDAMRDQVGLDIVERGAFQGQTSLFTRGADSNKTLIYVDGVKAYDPISPNGAYNLAHLTLDNVESIEVLRGPQSALYGSDA
ncbi:MAG: TonB-dependent receptor plug domain-containing protein, partial [Candidatus Omnitrophica bacterium]|nr:TonB-dependent receptor plug domain-containing protein [Candidatus Omnitrophota bacterium]